MTDDIRSPAELRAMFGANLRQLAQQYPTVSGLCRQLGINRTQFNRYLGGESFPRPDVLDRICRFFDTDARILLKPLDDIVSSPQPQAVSGLTDFFWSDLDTSSSQTFLPGFYAVEESKPAQTTTARLGLIHAQQLPQCTLVRAYAARAAMPSAAPPDREMRGIAASVGDQFCILMSCRNGLNSRLYLIVQGEESGTDHWQGRMIGLSDPLPKDRDATLVTFRHLGQDAQAVFETARKTGRGLARA